MCSEILYHFEVKQMNLLFLKILFILFLERDGEKERGSETSMCGCLSHAPHWGPGPQPGHVPQTLVHRPALNPLSYTSQGKRIFSQMQVLIVQGHIYDAENIIFF